MKYECEKLLGKFDFWDKLSEEEKTSISKEFRLTEYKAKSNVHGGKEGCTGAICVSKGELRVYMLSEEGREITLYRMYPGDICVLSASCVLKSITFDVFVDAEVDSEVYVMNSHAFANLVENNVYVENFMLNVAVERFSDVMWAMQQILFMSFDKRLAIFLLDESAKTGSDTINLTHEQIAKYMGSAREVVSRMLKYFSTENIVALRRSGVEILDKKKLQKIAA